MKKKTVQYFHMEYCSHRVRRVATAREKEWKGVVATHGAIVSDAVEMRLDAAVCTCDILKKSLHQNNTHTFTDRKERSQRMHTFR